MSKRAWIMLLCCLAMLAAVVALQRGASPGSLGTVALFLLCPLMHIMMMRGMGHGRRGQPADEVEGSKDSANRKTSRPAPHH